MGNGDENVLYAGAIECRGKEPVWLVPVCPACGGSHTTPKGDLDNKIKCPKLGDVFHIKEIPEGKRAVDPQDINEAGELLHRFDPCIYCGTPLKDVEIGPCPGMTN